MPGEVLELQVLKAKAAVISAVAAAERGRRRFMARRRHSLPKRQLSLKLTFISSILLIRQRGQKGSGRSIACKTDRDRGKVIKRTVAVDDAPSALALD